MTQTFDYRSDAEDEIKYHFENRASAKGEVLKPIKRAFFGISSSGAVSYYCYRSGDETVYLSANSRVYKNAVELYLKKPDFFPKAGAREGKWEVI